MFLPYKVDVPMARWPWANWAIMLATIVVSIALFGPLSNDRQAADGIVYYFLLQPSHFHPFQLVGHVLAHAGWLHLVGNMLFLWIFGNAINAKVGHLQYILLYFGIGVVESLIWVLIGPAAPALGASGAIMGVVGAFLLLYPANDISCIMMISYAAELVEFSAGWLIALYAAFDIYGTLFQRSDGVGYLAHVTGFLCGAGITAALLWWKWIEPAEGERTLFQVLGWMPENPNDIEAIRDTYLPKSTTAPVRQAQAPLRPSSKARDNSPIPFD